MSPQAASDAVPAKPLFELLARYRSIFKAAWAMRSRATSDMAYRPSGVRISITTSDTGPPDQVDIVGVAFPTFDEVASFQAVVRPSEVHQR